MQLFHVGAHLLQLVRLVHIHTGFGIWPTDGAAFDFDLIRNPLDRTVGIDHTRGEQEERPIPEDRRLLEHILAVVDQSSPGVDVLVSQLDMDHVDVRAAKRFAFQFGERAL